MSSIEENVKAMIPQMTLEIAGKIKEQALGNIERYASSAIADEVKKYVADTIIPMVQQDLAAQQDAIKAAIVAACKGVAEALAEALTSKMTAKLASYEGDKLITAVFGPMFRGY